MYMFEDYIAANAPGSSMNDLLDLEDDLHDKQLTKLTDLGFGSVLNVANILCVSNTKQMLKATPVNFSTEPETFIIKNAKSLVYLNGGDNIDVKITAEKIHTCIADNVRTSWLGAACEPSDQNAYWQYTDFVTDAEKNMSLNKLAEKMLDRIKLYSDESHLKITISGHCRIEFFTAGTADPYPFEIGQLAYLID